MAESKIAEAQIVLGGDAHLNIDRKGSMMATHNATHDVHGVPLADYEGKPTEEERLTLRRVAGKVPLIAYLICIVEFAERSSYYGVQPLFGNFVNKPLPKGGNGYGAPPRGSQKTAGALGMGTVKASAVSQSFSMLTYTLPMLFAWIADTKTGRFRMIFIGVWVCGIAHVLMVASGAPNLLANGNSKIPFFISVYVLCIGAAMFKPNISPVLLDQMKDTNLKVKTLKSGERVIVDPEHTTERTMLWFYWLINVGGFMNVPTSYTAKYVGWWLSFLLPVFFYLPLPIILWFMRKRLVLYPPGGSDLGNVFRVLGVCFKRGGVRKIFKGQNFFDAAKPSFIAESGNHIDVPWNDSFVDDVRRTFQATGIFCFFPIQYINDNGLGGAANAMSNMFTTNGVPNDVLSNFNSLSIIVAAPILNYGLYPFLRNRKIHYGLVARMTTGLFMSAVGGLGYTLCNYYAYKLGPCGHFGTSESCVDADGNALVSNITIWYMAIPYAIGGVSELFINVPAYGLAYSRAPKNMRSLVSALNLLSTGFAYALGLAFSGLIKDPYLTWDFGAPAIIGFVASGVFYYLFRHLDNEEYTISDNGDYHLKPRTASIKSTESIEEKASYPHDHTVTELPPSETKEIR